MKRLLLRFVVAVAAVLAILGLAFWGLLLTVSRSPVDVAAFRAATPRATRIFDRNGVLLRQVANEAGVHAFPVPLSFVSPRLVDAVIAAEDDSFRSHGGVDVRSVIRAFLSDASKGRVVSGASTLTMQLARLTFGDGRDLKGKLRQSFDALRLERALSKDEILEAYLNRVPFGNGRIGVEAACLTYLGKTSDKLSVAEAALIAGLIQAPSLYDPSHNPDGARRRRDWVIERLFLTGHISAANRDEALATSLPSPSPENDVKAGHFTDYVLSQSTIPGDIVTTLDWSLQSRVEEMTADYVRKASLEGLTNAAVIIVDNVSGAILAMVGSKAWSADNRGYVNGAIALRQPGSTLKPFAYALAFENGYSPASMLADIETEYVSSDRALYIPRNYSRTFRGPVLAKEALASSLNIPAIRLVRSVGLDRYLTILHDFGFASLKRDADYYGLGLVLGNGEVTLLEIARAYSTLARGGLYLPLSFIPTATAPLGTRVATYEATWLVTSILSDENMRVQAFGADTPLLVGFPMAIKTGTSGDWRDSWTIGYTSEFTVAVWGGDFGATPMNQLSGSLGAGPLFKQVAELMADRLGRLPSLPEPPPSARQIVVCAESGDIPTAACPRRTVVSVCDNIQRPLCTMHVNVSVDSRTGEPADESTPSAFLSTRLAYNLPPRFAAWLAESGKYPLPAKHDGVMAPTEALAIRSPRSGDVYLFEPGYDPSTQSIELLAEFAKRSSASSVSWYVDGELVAEAPWPYSATWHLTKGNHSVVAKVGELSSKAVFFAVK
jgi:penicillin-binding protein 1C